MDNINNVILRDHVIKICDIRPCGCNIPLSTVHVSGYKNILARLTISDIRKLLASGIRVCEYTRRDETNNLNGLQVITTNNFNRVTSMEHIKLLKSINRGYIDMANSIFAGAVTPAPPENKKEEVEPTSEAEPVAEKEEPVAPEAEPVKEDTESVAVETENTEDATVSTNEESESSTEETEDAPSAETQARQNNSNKQRKRKNNRH